LVGWWNGDGWPVPSQPLGGPGTASPVTRQPFNGNAQHGSLSLNPPPRFIRGLEQVGGRGTLPSAASDQGSHEPVAVVRLDPREEPVALWHMAVREQIVRQR
jgi:hypothetical protein